MAEQIVGRAMAIASHSTAEHGVTLSAARGERGLGAEQVSQEAAMGSNVLGADEGFQRVKTSAQTAGKGTGEKRIALLVRGYPCLRPAGIHFWQGQVCGMRRGRTARWRV
jgi:hypothetical protein